MRKKNISAYQVGMTYIGTVIGAGFASGQEILQFFVKFGTKGLFGICLSSIMFIIFGYMVMLLGKRIKAHSHGSVIKYVGGDSWGKVIDYTVTFFLFMTLTTMLAGTGALFQQQFNIYALTGNLIMAVITVVTVFSGIHGIVNSISAVTPFLFISIIGIGIFTVVNTPPDLTCTIVEIGKTSLIDNWILAAFLYSSYNITLSLAVLGPLGVEAKNKNKIRKGALVGGLGLGLGALTIYLVILSDIKNLSGLEIPMIYFAGNISKIIQYIYVVVLMIAIYTTAVGNLYGLTTRIQDIKRICLNKNITLILTTIAALITSQLGFRNLVMYLYPLAGFAGLIFIVCMIIKAVKPGKNRI